MTSGCRLLRSLVDRSKQALQVADTAHDCVEARGPVWRTGGKPGVAVVRVDPLRLEVNAANGAIAIKIIKWILRCNKRLSEYKEALNQGIESR